MNTKAPVARLSIANDVVEARTLTGERLVAVVIAGSSPSALLRAVAVACAHLEHDGFRLDGRVDISIEAGTQADAARAAERMLARLNATGLGTLRLAA